MNRQLAHCVVESLCVTGSFEESLARLKTFGEGDWQQTLPWLDESGLALYLLKRVSDSDSLDLLPAGVRTQLQRNLAANQRRLAEMKKEFDSLNRCFAAAGVDYAVLKGFALVPEFCPDASLRSQYDYDYLVHPDSATVAQQVLEGRGYARKLRSPGFEKENVLLFARQALSIPLPDQNFYSASLPRSVELHLGLWDPIRDRVGLEVPRDALSRKRLVTWEGVHFPVLAEDDSLTFQVLHAFQHILSYWCRPSCFFEVAFFLAGRQGDSAFWERFQRRVKGHKRLAQIAGLIFSLAELLYHAPIPSEVPAWTTRTLPDSLSLWVWRYGNDWALCRFPGSKLSLFVHREFIEEPGVWKEIRRSRLFPFHPPAKVVEPDETSLGSHWFANWDQACFVLSRLKFHLGGLLRYAWELPAWKRSLRNLDRGDSRRHAEGSVKPAELALKPCSARTGFRWKGRSVK